MSQQSLLASLAIIKVNFDEKVDYLGSFVPLVAECIRRSSAEVISESDLQTRLKNTFGLSIPRHIIRTILKRAERQDYLYREAGVYKPNRQSLGQLDFHQIQTTVLEHHQSLIAELVAHVSGQFSLIWSREEAEDYLTDYLEENQLRVIRNITNGDEFFEETLSENYGQKEKYIVAHFIQYLQQQQTASLRHLETVIQGNMLANAIYLPHPNEALRKFKGTEIFFDTSFLMKALGYSGPEQQAPCTELIRALRHNGANLRCFNHTVVEIQNNLRVAQVGITNPKGLYGPAVDTVKHFVSQKKTPSDIEGLIRNIADELRRHQIIVSEKPAYIHRYQISEEKLSSYLQGSGYNRNSQYSRALQYDVDSISAIMRLRYGQEYLIFEECKALFVTDNTYLARVTQDFFYKELNAPQDAIAPCITDYALTNILWLKSPSEAPDLPKKRIIADCYAATQPSDSLFQRYIDETYRLEANQDRRFTPEDYFVLRYSPDAREALMQLTLGEEEAFTQGTVAEILERIDEIKSQELRSELESTQRELQKKGQTIESTIERERDREVRIRGYSLNLARAIVRLANFLIFLVLVITAIFSAQASQPDAVPLVFGLLSAIALLSLILSIIDLVWDRSITSYTSKIEPPLSNYLFEKLQKWFG